LGVQGWARDLVARYASAGSRGGATAFAESCPVPRQAYLLTARIVMNYLHALFDPFVERIRPGKACEDTGVEPATLPLVEELSFNRSAFESEFATTPEPRQIRITWNGIANLWAFGEGPGESPRAAFEAQRVTNPEDPPPELLVERELLMGTRFLELSARLAKHQFDHWVDWLPGPDAPVRHACRQ
jgi:hypothetical protein